MRQITQRILHDPAAGINGDCFRCCVASVLNLDYESVPHFMERPADDWFAKFASWLLEHYRLVPLAVVPNDDLRQTIIGCACILSGPSPRFPGELHSVIGCGLKVDFDPHPDRTGLPGGVTDCIVFVEPFPETHWTKP